MHTSAIASSLALLYPTVDAALQTGIITIVVFLHNVALLSLAFCCMKANKRILIMGLFIWLALFPWVLDHYWHTNVTERQIMSYMTVVLHGFRLLRVWGGMLPKEATESFVNYMMYCALPGELKVSDDGRLVKAPRGVLLRRFVPCWLFHTLCLYLMASYGHQLAVFFLPKQFTGVLKKNFLKTIFGYEARCEFWVKIGLRFWILEAYVDFLAKFGAKLSFRV